MSKLKFDNKDITRLQSIIWKTIIMFSTIFLGLLPGAVFFLIVRKHMQKKDANHCEILILIFISLYLLFLYIFVSSLAYSFIKELGTIFWVIFGAAWIVFAAWIAFYLSEKNMTLQQRKDFFNLSGVEPTTTEERNLERL